MQAGQDQVEIERPKIPPKRPDACKKFRLYNYELKKYYTCPYRMKCYKKGRVAGHIKNVHENGFMFSVDAALLSSREKDSGVWWKTRD